MEVINLISIIWRGPTPSLVSSLARKVLAYSLIFLALIFFSLACGSPSAAKLEVKKEVIKTYPFSDPDPVPIMVRGGMWGKGARLYPYHFIDRMSLDGQGQEWTVVTLENPFVKVEILPEVGGKVWGALDKTTGKYFIYKNEVLKFREVALRGPWTSGGIEFNFGIVGHSPATATPVNFTTRRRRDGQLSCIVGTWDWPSRTRWSVEISLEPNKVYFTTRSLWTNFTPYFQSYYVWLNAAIRAGEDLQFILPGQKFIGHNYSVPLQPWPVDGKGRDLSWYKNNNFGSSKSYFTVGEYRGFFGAYWHDDQQGFGHWAFYQDVPGHKMWIWSLARDGGIWEDLLTDSNGQYCEPQAGRLLNQSDHGHFFPLYSEEWQEIWFPYHLIGPLKAASPFAVLNVEKKGEKEIEVKIFPLQEISEKLKVENSQGLIYEEEIFLKAGKPWAKNISTKTFLGEYKINLGDKLAYSSSPQSGKFQKPLVFQNYDRSSLQRHFLRALKLEKERNLAEAFREYQALLGQEPDFLPALVRLAELYLRRGEVARAFELSQKAVAIDMYNGPANYVYALVARAKGLNIEAKEALTWAARDRAFQAAAYNQLAEIFLSEGKLRTALEFAQRALGSDPQGIPHQQLLALILRKKGETKKAQEVISKIEERDPLNPLTKLEKYWRDPTPGSWKKFRSFLHEEFPEETILEVALYYYRLNQLEETLHLLQKIDYYPPASYWLSYLLRHQDQDQSAYYLKQAQSLSPYLVFPFREESIPVFKWAIAKQPNDWKAKYYLALLLWSKGREEEAEQLLASCGNASDYPPFYIVRGYLGKHKSLPSAQRDYERTVSLEKKDWRNWHHLLRFYLEVNQKEKAFETAEKALTLFPDDMFIKVDAVEVYMANQEYQRAAQILEETTFLPYEGATKIHRLFVECHLELGLSNLRQGDLRQAIRHFQKAKSYPERLGTGQPFEPDTRLPDILLGICYQRIGEAKLAQRHFQLVRDYTLQHWSQKSPYQGLAAVFLIRKFKMTKAVELLKKYPITEKLRKYYDFIIREIR